MLRKLRILAMRFSSSKVSIETPEAPPPPTPQSEKIAKLLSIPPIIDLDKKQLFRGNLIVCPTPLGNLKDLSVRAIEALTTADVIACEDTKTTGKLLYLLRTKDFETVIGDIRETQEIVAEIEEVDDQTVDTEEFRPKSENFTSEELRAHPNLIDLRRDRRKAKEISARLDLSQRIVQTKKELSRVDALGFLSEYERAKDLEFYDSTQKRRVKDKDQETYGIEDPYIRYIRAKVEESKLKKKRGLLISCHSFNEEFRVENLLKLMRSGMKVVLASDAGTPVLADPGSKLISAARANKITVDVLPGPSVVSLALCNSGFPANHFRFESYFPKEKKLREKLAEEFKKSPVTLMFFENKTRIIGTLATLERLIGPHQKIYVGVELTKLHERNLIGSIRHVYETLNSNPDYTIPSLKGEITCILAPYQPGKDDIQDFANENTQRPKFVEDQKTTQEDPVPVYPSQAIALLLESMKVSNADLAIFVSQLLKISKNKAYKLINLYRKHMRKRSKSYFEELNAEENGESEEEDFEPEDDEDTDFEQERKKDEGH